MNPRDEIYAEAYRRGLMNDEQKAAYEEGVRRGLFTKPEAPERNLWERLTQNFEDGFERGPVRAARRWGIGDALPMTPLGVLSGEAREFVASGGARTVPGVERDRRVDFEAVSKADPWYSPDAAPPTPMGRANVALLRGAVTLMGQLGGAAADPSSWLGGGRTVATRIASAAATNAGADVATQGLDLASDTQDEFSLTQTAMAAAVGAGLGSLAEAARPLAKWAEDAFTAPREPKPEPESAAPTAATKEAPNGVEIPEGAKVIENTEAGAVWENPDGSLEGEVVTGNTDGAGAVNAQPAPPVDPGTQPLAFVRPVEPKGLIRQAKQKIDEKGLLPAIGEAMDRLYTATVAEQHPIPMAVEGLRSRIESKTGKPLDILPGDDPRKLARGSYDVRAIGHMDIMNGVVPYRGTTPEGPALGEVFAAVTAREVRDGISPEDALKGFNDYLTARRGVEEWARRARGELDRDPLPADKGGDAVTLQAHITAAEAANPHFVELADQVNEYGRLLWKKSFDAGLIDKESYEAANAARTFYVPFRRVMDESASAGGAGSAKGSVAKKFKGSDRDVLGPLETLAQQTYEINRRIRQNEINAGMVKLATTLDKLLGETGANGVMRKVKAPSKPITVTGEEIARNGWDAMMSEDSFTIYRPGELNEGGRAIIYAWKDGKREAWEILDPDMGRDLYNAMTGMSREMADVMTTFLAAPSAVLRAGVTTNPEFLVTNFIRDQLSAWVLTDVGFNPGIDVVGGLKDPGRFLAFDGIRGVGSELGVSDAISA